MTSWAEETNLYDRIFHIFYAITGTFGILLNALLLYCTIYRNPKSLKEYRIIIIKSIITDLVLIFSVAFVEPRMIPIDTMYVYIVNGPAYYFGPNVAFVFYGLVLNMFFYMIISFPLPFAYRYYVIIKPCDRRKQLLLASIGLYAIAFLQLVAFLFTQTDEVYVRKFLKSRLPEIEVKGKVIFGSDLILNPLTIVIVITSVVTSLPVYIVIIYYRWKVLTALKGRVTQLSEATISTHQKLMKAVTIHATLPAFFVFAPILLYLIGHFGILNATISEYLVFAMVSCLPVADSLVTIYCIKPYYDAIRRMFHLHVLHFNLDGLIATANANKITVIDASKSNTKIFKVRSTGHA